MSQQEKIPVLITTERGVYFGYINPNDFFNEAVEVEKMRCAVYWAASVKGFPGLAATGPNSECRISPPTPRTVIRGVKSVSDVTPAAVKAWEAGPWTK